MSTTLRRRPARRAAALAVALVGATLALTPAAPAQALPTGGITGGTLTWGISGYLNSSNFGRPNPYPTAYVAPSTFIPAVPASEGVPAVPAKSTWGNATGTVSPNGSATINLAGTTVNYASTSGAWLKLADPQVTLDADGNGALTALVSYRTVPGTQENPGDPTYNDTIITRGPLRMTVVDLAGNTSADRTGTPAQTTWTDLDGTFSTTFKTFLQGDATAEPAIAAWTYAGTFTAAADRQPSPMTFVVNTASPAVQAQITGSNAADGLTVGVSATGFRAVTNPGDAGVYVGIAPSGGLPDVSTPESMANFAAYAYALPGQIVDGAWSKTLNAVAADLDSTKTYSVYTWQAHTHSNTTQDTETPLAIDFPSLEKTTGSVVASGPASKVFGSTATLTATTNGGGSVTLTGVGPQQTKDVASGGGTVSFTVPADLAVGSYTATFAYSGAIDVTSASATKTLAVTKYTPVVKANWKKKPTAAKAGKLTVSVSGPAGLAKPAGDVVVKVKQKGVKHKLKGTLKKNGKITLTVPKLRAGTWTISGAYKGGGGAGKATFKEFTITITVK